MKTKIIVVFGIIGLFIISGFAAFPAMGGNASLSNQISENKNIVIKNSEELPDLFPEISHWIDDFGGIPIYS